MNSKYYLDKIPLQGDWEYLWDDQFAVDKMTKLNHDEASE